MKTYLKETEYTSIILFDTLYIEKSKLFNLNDKLLSKKNRLEQLQHNFAEISSYSQEFNIPKLETDIIDLESSIINQKISFQIVGTSILQIAMQGILKTFGNPENCPNGRNIGSQSLKNVIGCGRNQSIHYKEGDYNNHVVDCFIDLKNNFGNDFDLNNSENLSTNIIYQILRWNSYSDYYYDMFSFK